jgi:phosphoribosyl 1,2-cyclic phosphodiesterase
MTKTDKNNFEVKFWGTRGTLPVAGSPFARTGGNTNCIEVTCGNHTIIIDAGTGIRELGSKLVSACPDQKIHLFLSHAHYDHVEGIPFFAPFFVKDANIDICCGKLEGSKNTSELISNLMARPFFPVGPEVFSATMQYKTLEENSTFNISNQIKISTAPMNHPGGSTGYRIDFDGKSFACVTDTEHVTGKHDENILRLIDNVDVFSYDCSLMDKEMDDFRGYGHSTFEEGMRLAKIANAGSMRASHHMPFRNDEELDEIEKAMTAENPDHAVAREGDSFKL